MEGLSLYNLHWKDVKMLPVNSLNSFQLRNYLKNNIYLSTYLYVSINQGKLEPESKEGAGDSTLLSLFILQDNLLF